MRIQRGRATQWDPKPASTVVFLQGRVVQTDQAGGVRGDEGGDAHTHAEEDGEKKERTRGVDARMESESERESRRDTTRTEETKERQQGTKSD